MAYFHSKWHENLICYTDGSTDQHTLSSNTLLSLDSAKISMTSNGLRHLVIKYYFLKTTLFSCCVVTLTGIVDTREVLNMLYSAHHTSCAYWAITLHTPVAPLLFKYPIWGFSSSIITLIFQIPLQNECIQLYVEYSPYPQSQVRKHKKQTDCDLFWYTKPLWTKGHSGDPKISKSMVLIDHRILCTLLMFKSLLTAALNKK